MKSKIKKYLTILAILPFLYSCEHETLPTYSGIDNIYFNAYDPVRLNDFPNFLTVKSGSDSINTLFSSVKFGYDPVIKTDSVISLMVKVLGSVTDYDRPVNFILSDSWSSAQLGKDIELLTDRSFVPAGSITGNIYIKLHNSEWLNDNEHIATLRLAENEFFKTDYTRTRFTSINRDEKFMSTQFLVQFDSMNETPNLWAHSTYGANISLFFGKYSRVKFAAMCEVLPGCTREYFTYEPDENPQTVFLERFPTGLMTGWARGFYLYLLYYEEINGEPLLDENGEEVKNGVYQL